MFTTCRIVGVGGAGIAILNRIADENLVNSQCIAVDTYHAQLIQAKTRRRIIISESGMGSGGDPKIGEASARQNVDYIQNALSGTEKIIIAGGLGGGTASGALPVIAEVARNLGCQTTAIVTFPLSLEGAQRHMIAQNSVNQLDRQCRDLEVLHCDQVAASTQSRALQQIFALTERAVTWKILARFF